MELRGEKRQINTTDLLIKKANKNLEAQIQAL